jgi:phage recombination protein Bet
MAKKQSKQLDQAADQPRQPEQVPAIAGPRLPYHPAIEERFGIDRSAWKALVEAIFPVAQTSESVILALSYCKARKLDPFKRNVHIVPIWDKAKGRYTDTVWPGIGELRTTAFRTQSYAGRAATVFGPDKTMTWGGLTITFPECAQVTVFRIVQGERVAFAGPPVYWLEAYASTKDGSPNSMWQKRPRGQLDKCAEAAALRAAFPEEIGDDLTSDEGPMIFQHGQEGFGGPANGLKSGTEKAKAILGIETPQAAAEPPISPEADEPIPPECDEPTETIPAVQEPAAESPTEIGNQAEPASTLDRYRCTRCKPERTFIVKPANGRCPVCLAMCEEI